MQQFPFYEQGMMAITNTNPHARLFVMDFMKFLGKSQSVNDGTLGDGKNAQIAESYVFKSFHVRFECDIDRSKGNWTLNKNNGVYNYKHGVYIPIEIWRDIVFPYFKDMQFECKSGKVLIDVFVSPMYIANKICSNGVIGKYADGGQSVIKYEDGIKVTYNKAQNILILREFMY